MKAKFKCVDVIETTESSTFFLSVVLSGSPENESFSKFTPAGELRIQISKETNAINFFKVGEEYYLDFTKCGA